MEQKYLDLIKQVLGKDAKVVSSLNGGMMSQTYIVEANSKQYVFYVPTVQANEMVYRPLEKESQSIVSSLGITSKNVYFDTDSGIKINEYIKGDSLNHLDSYDIKKIAKIMHILHSSPTLSSKDYNPLDKLEMYKKETISYGIRFTDAYHHLIEFINQNSEFLKSQKLVLCHNDAQKSNIVKDDNDNYYLIDFEFTMNNDPLFDIAGFGNDNVNEGYELLKEYIKLSPQQDPIKRFCLWRIVLSLQWYLVALIKDYRGEGKVHNFDFYQVAMHFINNALEAYNLLKREGLL